MTVICLRRILPHDELCCACPDWRRAEIERVSEPSFKNARAAVTNALSEAMHEFCGKDLIDAGFEKNAFGKPVCRGLYISLSHCSGFAAAAVSDSPIGIDIELPAHISKQGPALERLVKRICSPEEADAQTSPEAFLELWTQKEAVFKYLDERLFCPSSINTAAYPLATFYPENGDGVILSVCCGKTGNKFSFIGDVGLTTEKVSV